MKTERYFVHIFWNGALGLALLATPVANAATLWTGPNTNFVQFVPSPSDQLTPGVALTRGSSQPLYNAVTETFAGPDSPADTLWAFGTIDNYTNLSYQSFASLRNGNLASVILNQPMVLQLVNEQIYISIEFTAWGRQGAGGFAYTRSTPAATPPPTPSVGITNLASGAMFAAPASIPVGASATVSSGSVTNVAFFGNSASLGSVTNAPFKITTSNLAAGSYALTAVATAAGVSATSAIVNISVVTPIAIALSTPQTTNGVFEFIYTANPGLSYVVQSSSNFTTWLSLATNVPSSSPALYTNTLAPNGYLFYRVGRLTNP